MYKLSRSSASIIRVADNAFIPADPDNADYAAYLSWVGDGNTAAPADGYTKEEFSQQVDSKRDAAIEAGVTFNGKLFQTRVTDRENIAGATQLAFMAIVAGAQPGDLSWSDPAEDFHWIAEDNSLVSMDAQTVVALGRAVAAHKSACIFKARALKDAIEATMSPEELATVDIDAGWPD